MVSFFKFVGLSLAAISTATAASVPSVTSELVARDDANSQICGCNSQTLLDIIYKVENFGQEAAKNIAAQIDSQHPDHEQIEGTVDELTELINALLNYNHGTLCVDSGILGSIVSIVKVQIELIKALLANIGLFPFNIIKSINLLIKAVFDLANAVFGAISVKKDMHCFLCADVQTFNTIGYILSSLVQLVDPNVPALPALSCDNA